MNSVLKALLAGFFISCSVWFMIILITIMPLFPSFLVGFFISFVMTLLISMSFICACYVTGTFDSTDN